MTKFNTLFLNVFDNTIDPFIPSFWARESLIVLVENMVAANLVHRDFEPLVAQFGDTVNTRKPSELVAYRKTNADNVTIQDVSATNVAVKLDQHVHTSFLIKDGEESKSMVSLVNEYLRPAVVAMARFVDIMVLGQYAQFLDNEVGSVLGLTSNNARDTILDLRNQQNIKKVPDDGRVLILNNNSETTLLKLDLFTQAQQVGDTGSALANATLGKKLGFNMYRAYNMAIVNTGNTTVTGAINLTAGYAKGSTSAMVVDGFSAAVATGSWAVIDGAVYRITAHAETMSATTSITVHRALDRAVANDAVITVYSPAAVNLVAGYAVGWSKAIVIDGTTPAPQVGQAVTFGTATPATTPVYTIIAVSGATSITLDRPLEVAIANDDAVNLGPAGNYNFTFHKNAIALVNRPLALPTSGVGAKAGTFAANGLSMRSTITYNGEKQGHLVTLDMLLGIKVLDVNLGAVMLG